MHNVERSLEPLGDLVRGDGGGVKTRGQLPLLCGRERVGHPKNCFLHVVERRVDGVPLQILPGGVVVVDVSGRSPIEIKGILVVVASGRSMARGCNVAVECNMCP